MVERSSLVAPRPVGAVLLMALVSLLVLPPARSQQLLPPAPSDTSREHAYEELAQEAEALQRYFSLLKKVVKVVRPTVVHIEADREEIDRFSRRRRVEEAGSGVIIRSQEKFYILTNRHVIKDAPLDQINIKLADGRHIHPVSLWADPGTDVAVMEVAEQGLVPARLGDSREVEIGDFVLAVGSPFGLSHSVTYGIVSAKGRRDLKLGEESVRYQDFLQTDAAINPGNSGGPLLNLRGEVIGINTAIASSSGGNDGIGFSIPINMVMAVARQLIERGRVVRAFLGVHLDSKFGPEAAARLGLPRPAGARVSGITPESPAEAARLQVGDVILAFDGVPIEDDNDLVNRVSLTPVGKRVPVVVFRQGKQITVEVTVGQRNRFETPE